MARNQAKPKGSFFLFFPGKPFPLYQINHNTSPIYGYFKLGIGIALSDPIKKTNSDQRHRK
jgi:hypothetical protein